MFMVVGLDRKVGLIDDRNSALGDFFNQSSYNFNLSDISLTHNVFLEQCHAVLI